MDIDESDEDESDISNDSDCMITTFPPEGGFIPVELPYVHLDFVFDNIVPHLSFCSQQDALCGLHTIQNLLQVTDGRISHETFVALSSSMVASGIRSELYEGGQHYTSNGWYTNEIIFEFLQRQGKIITLFFWF